MTRTCQEIRDEFIEFFTERAHALVPSSPLLPAGDPTLLFTNAGMNQFKDIFLAREKRDYVRATNSQKCIRAGGKHNDLEDVGHDCYHHTFFEMLGNWSFGDYFKAEAIQWAWELLTDVWGLPKDRLYATVFGGDDGEGPQADEEAAQLWTKVTDIDPSHVQRWGRKDNFWEMGQTGPCGPCSEIHIDLTDDGTGAKLVNAGAPRVIELWNLVFMQFDRDESGVLSPLPARHVDTGMGLERIGFVLAGKHSNYATDLFVPLIEKTETLTDHRYGSSSGPGDRFDVTGADDIRDVACRVVADHARALTFAIADGVIPSNEGRGYVLRRILRRAARYGREHLRIEAPFLCELVPTLVEVMGEAFPEIRQRREYVIDTIRAEEQSFNETLDRGIEKARQECEAARDAGSKTLTGEVAFELYATYGFPTDLTQVIAAEHDLAVDLEGYEKAMQRHRELSGAGGAFKAEDVPDLPTTDDSAKYSRDPIETAVLGWVAGGEYVTDGELGAGDEAAVVLARTSFYAEQGGQVGDTGRLAWDGGQFTVNDTQPAGGGIVHVGKVLRGAVKAGAKVRCEVSPSRFDTMRNHTATHLLNWALRGVLGSHVDQAGSVVAADRLRFDFTHSKQVGADELEEVERLVNERVLRDEAVVAKVVALAEAREISGVRAVFGEKYPDPVRVITIGVDEAVSGGSQCASVEFCGGTHLERTSQVGLFKIVSEDSVAKGVRRITALTGHGAVEHVRRLDQVVKAATAALRASPEDLTEHITAMQKEIKRLRKRPSPGTVAAKLETIETSAGQVRVGVLDDADAAAMRNLCDRERQKGAVAVFVGGAAGAKVTLVAMVCEELAGSGRLAAGDWVRAAAPVVGGGGGGKPTLAQAGGKQPDKLPEALAEASRWVREKLG